MLGMPPTAQTDHSYRCIQGNHLGDTHMTFVVMTENAPSVTHSHVAVYSQRNRASINRAWHIQKSPGGSALRCISISGFIYVEMWVFFLFSYIFLYFLQYLQKFEFAEYLLVRGFFIIIIYFRLYSKSGLFFNMLNILIRWRKGMLYACICRKYKWVIKGRKINRKKKICDLSKLRHQKPEEQLRI